MNFLFLLLMSFTAFSQSLSGFIGEATDETALIGASLYLEDIKTGEYIDGTISDIDGTFNIDNVKAGTYNMTLEYSSFESIKKKVKLKKGYKTTVHALLGKAKSQYTVGIESYPKSEISGDEKILSITGVSKYDNSKVQVVLKKYNPKTKRFSTFKKVDFAFDYDFYAYDFNKSDFGKRVRVVVTIDKMDKAVYETILLNDRFTEMVVKANSHHGSVKVDLIKE